MAMPTLPQNRQYLGNVPSAAANLAEARRNRGTNITGRAEEPMDRTHFRTGNLVKAQDHRTAWNENADPKTDPKYTQGQSAKIQSGQRWGFVTEVLSTLYMSLPTQSCGGNGLRQPEDKLVARLITMSSKEISDKDGNHPTRVTVSEGDEIKAGSFVHLEQATPVFFWEDSKVVGRVGRVVMERILRLMGIDPESPTMRW